MYGVPIVNAREVAPGDIVQCRLTLLEACFGALG